MKKIINTIFVIVIIMVIGVGAWYFFMRKLPEGAVCNGGNCETGLKCLNKICSSGIAGSSCEAKTDCKSNFCVNNKCTEGKKDNVCLTYKDCETGLFCKKGTCSEPPSYSQYFSKIVVSKMKVGTPPGPDNLPVITTEFKTTDALEIDFIGVKSTTIGKAYYEVIDQVTGEVLFSSSGYKIDMQGRDIGTGSDLPRSVGEGVFDLNIYYNDELIYTTVITISD